MPSEWLGDRCPAAVLLIEIRMHTRLKKAFSCRDRPAGESPPRLYGFAVGKDGYASYIGEVVAETSGRVRLKVANILSLWSGVWDLRGEVRDFRRSCVRLFTDRDECIEQHSRGCKPLGGRVRE